MRNLQLTTYFDVRRQNGEKVKSWPSTGIKPRAPVSCSSSCQCSITGLWPPDNHQPLQSSICTAQVVYRGHCMYYFQLRQNMFKHLSATDDSMMQDPVCMSWKIILCWHNRLIPICNTYELERGQCYFIVGDFWTACMWHTDSVHHIFHIWLQDCVLFFSIFFWKTTVLFSIHQITLCIKQTLIVDILIYKRLISQCLYRILVTVLRLQNDNYPQDCM